MKKTHKQDSTDLAFFRYKFHNVLIEKLKLQYGTKKWKYRFIKNVKETYNINLQYNQLNVFEEGGTRNENILNLILLEFSNHNKDFSINIGREKGRVVVSIKNGA